jgi:hypothetical protein
VRALRGEGSPDTTPDCPGVGERASHLCPWSVGLSGHRHERGFIGDGADGPGPPRGLRIAATGDVRGHLEPCDCRAGVLGGFARRATAFAELRPDLTVDAGKLVTQAWAYVRLRFLLSLVGSLSYDALNVGRREAAFSRAELLRLAAESPVP